MKKFIAILFIFCNFAFAPNVYSNSYINIYPEDIQTGQCSYYTTPYSYYPSYEVFVIPPPQNGGMRYFSLRFINERNHQQAGSFIMLVNESTWAAHDAYHDGNLVHKTTWNWSNYIYFNPTWGVSWAVAFQGNLGYQDYAKFWAEVCSY